MIKKVKSNVLWRYIVSGLKGEENVGTFCKKELQKTKQKELTVRKVVKRKGDKLYVKGKEYMNSFNSWIDKKA